jgi:hypothetical protein
MLAIWVALFWALIKEPQQAIVISLRELAFFIHESFFGPIGSG